MSDDPWFIYKREGGRFRATPANWQGWSTFIGGIALTTSLGFKALSMAEGAPFFIRFVALGAIILTGVGAICFVAIRKGRPSL